MTSPLLARLVACILAGFAIGSAFADDAPPPFSGAPYASPVHWMPLGEAAFVRARRENKPVYVLTGSFLSELSRSTADSFANAETAAYFNAHFVCVLVDREVRPDFAAAAQDYIRTQKQFSGWPVSLWLTPEGQPFDGANYLPTIEEWGKRSMRQNAAAALAAWQKDPDACRRLAAEALAAMNAAPPEAKAGPAQVAAALASGLQGWRGQYDDAHPGFGDPPRYPQPELLRCLIRSGGEGRKRALASLRALAASALRDPLDGGFFRYLQDAEGRLPYPQKTLADQARLAQAYLDAYRADPDPVFAACARGALDYAQKLVRDDGLYGGAEDAIADGGLYYAWSAAGISAALGPDAAAFEGAYGVRAEGNLSADTDPSGQFSGRNLLYRAGSATDEARLGPARARLLALRERRSGLARDRRAAADAQGLLLAALAQSSAVLHEPRTLETARRLAEAIQSRLLVSAGVRPFADGEGAGSPTDYAALAYGFNGLLGAGSARDRTAYGAIPGRLLAACHERFFDPRAETYFAAKAPLAPGVFVRAPAWMLADDGPTPAALALLAAASDAPALRRGLLRRLAAGDPATGDLLLALLAGPEPGGRIKD